MARVTPIARRWPLALALLAGTGLALAGGTMAAAEALGPDQAVGRHILVQPDRLPAPNPKQSVGNASQVIKRPAAARLAVPDGFTATMIASDLAAPRGLLVLPNGDVLVAESYAGRLILLQGGDGAGRVRSRELFIGGLDRPFGLALQGGWIYVAEADQVRRLRYRDGDRKATGQAETVTEPGSLAGGGAHWTRSLAFSPDGRQFFIGIGSRSNNDREAPPHATIQVFNADGSGQRTYATGLRNATSLAFDPAGGELWTVVAERDGLGQNLVPDYLASVVDGGFYGWPYAYAGAHPDPRYGGEPGELVAKSRVPEVLIEAHATPLGLVFYTGDMFPPEYRGDAFISLHGSWNAPRPRGYTIVRVKFKDGAPVGGYDVFASGFWTGGNEPAEVWGRPVGLAVAKDGALLVADDAGGTIWRISYTKPQGD